MKEAAKASGLKSLSVTQIALFDPLMFLEEMSH